MMMMSKNQSDTGNQLSDDTWSEVGTRPMVYDTLCVYCRRYHLLCIVRTIEACIEDRASVRISGPDESGSRKRCRPTMPCGSSNN